MGRSRSIMEGRFSKLGISHSTSSDRVLQLCVRCCSCLLNFGPCNNVIYFRFAGLGPLRVPNIPSQLKAFTGTTVHTATWDPTIDFKDKNVAVIGSGARYAY